MKKMAVYCAAAAIGVAGLAITSVAAANGKNVAWFDTGATHPYVATLNKSLHDRAKELGFKVTQFDNNYDPAVQAQQVDDAIARKFDLLAIQSASQHGIIPALHRAKAAGIPVVIVNNGAAAGTEDLYVTEVGEDNNAIGVLAAESMMKALKESGRDSANVALITGLLAEGVAVNRLEGFNEAIKAMPNVKVVATEDAFWDTARTEQIASQLFVKHASTGGIDVMIGWADNQTAAIIRAAEAAGISIGNEKGKLLVLGMSCDRGGIQLIKEGKSYSTGLQSPMRSGARAAEVIAEVLAGKEVPKFVELPVVTIDSSNADEWTAACDY